MSNTEIAIIQHERVIKEGCVIPQAKNQDCDSGNGSDGTSQHEQEKRLMSACERGRLNEVIKVIEEEHVDPELCQADNSDHDTPVHVAAFYGHRHIVEYLVEKAKCKPQSINKYKNTPLHRAARQGKLDVVKYLIEKQNCNPMCECHWKRIPLHNACKHGRIEVVRYLTTLQSVNIHAKDLVDELTPLDLAAEFGRLEVVQYMYEEKGAGTERMNPETNTPLHLAAYKGNLEIVQYLIQKRGYVPSLRGKYGTPLHSACAGCQLDVVKYLLDVCKVDILTRDTQHHLSPLEMAAEHGAYKVVQHFIEEKQCVVKHGITNQNTALHQAAYGGKLDVVKYLIDRDCSSLSCKGRKGRMPLHSACISGKMDVVDYLINDCKVDAQIQDNFNATPLHLAAKRGQLELVKRLINVFGCEVTKDNYGKTPSDYASERKYLNIVGYLAHVDSITCTTLHKTLQTRLKQYTKKAIPTGMELGSGTYGSVIELKSAGEIVAGKIFRITSSAQLQGKANEVCGEVIMMLQLNDPHIVQCKGVCLLMDHPLPVLLMERLMSSLHAYLLHQDNSNLSVERKVSILQDTACGLCYLHSRNPAIIHRDLTAKNVLLDSKLQAKIADFGNSRLMDLDPESSPETLTGLPGTPEYMPPEAQGTYDPSLDVFSFGHLSLFIITQTPVRPLLPASYTDSNGTLQAQCEVKRREKFVKSAKELLSENHPLLTLLKQCLHNIPAQRPHAEELERRLRTACTTVSGACGSTGSKNKHSPSHTGEHVKTLTGTNSDVEDTATQECTASSVQPKRKDLANYVAAKIEDKWMKVADQLELTASEIHSIEADKSDSYSKFMAVMEQWSTTDRVPYTWDTLVTALESPAVNEVTLAKEIKDRFCRH